MSARFGRIASFRLVTQDLERLSRFYQQVLGFAPQGPVQPIASAEIASLGLAGSGHRQILGIGVESVAIDAFEQAGRPYPTQADAASLCFQHLALVVTDIAAAHARLRQTFPISVAGPQHLPAASGGAYAFKFRDPDGHPLELLQFPDGDAPPVWRQREPKTGQIALGIDHSAISVGDVEASTAFYRERGLRAAARTHNTGPAQQDLDDLQGVAVIVAPMLTSDAAPHLELLAYRVPAPGACDALRPNDVAATRIVWAASGAASEAALLRDPDGHLQQIERQEVSR